MPSNTELEAVKKGVREALAIYDISCSAELVDAIAVHALEAAEKARAKVDLTVDIYDRPDENGKPLTDQY